VPLGFTKSAVFTIAAVTLACLAPAGGILAARPTAGSSIATDRPTFANSSAVVPAGSVQLENGFGGSQSTGTTTWDLPETRVRLGIDACTEVLVDLPDYTVSDTSHGAHGWTSIAPTIKHQFDGLPDRLTLSAAIGVALPTGARQIVGHGPVPYVQLPWTFDLHGGWTINGMFSAIFHPDATASTRDYQSIVFVDKSVVDKADVFLEYANDSQPGAPALNRLSFGGSYRYAPTRQFDVKIGVGLNAAFPDRYFTVGYSMRFDRLF
jgi:hypothetical protein